MSLSQDTFPVSTPRLEGEPLRIVGGLTHNRLSIGRDVPTDEYNAWLEEFRDGSCSPSG